MDLGISGRRAAVAAASKGLGFAVASALVAEGVQVAVCGRHADTIEAAAAKLGNGAVPIVADLSTPDGAAGFVRDARAALGGIDILVANAGGPPPGYVLERDRRSVPRRVRAQLPFDDRDVLRGRARDARAALGPAWSRSRRSRSASRSRTSSSRTPPAPGVTGFLKTLAREIAADGVTVNSLLPGLHATERVAALHGGGGDPAAGIPAGVIGDPADFGRIAAFLCSQTRGLRDRHGHDRRRRRRTPRCCRAEWGCSVMSCCCGGYRRRPTTSARPSSAGCSRCPAQIPAIRCVRGRHRRAGERRQLRHGRGGRLRRRRRLSRVPRPPRSRRRDQQRHPSDSRRSGRGAAPALTRRRH